MTKFKVAVAKGDGIGPEVVDAALQVLKSLAKKDVYSFSFQEIPIGGYAIDSCGEPLPAEALDICRGSDAVLLGAVGGSKWEENKYAKKPESALLALRKNLGLYANLRPVKLFNELEEASPLKEEIIARGIDLCIVRELTGGIYFGPRGLRNNNRQEEEAYDTELYSRKEIERIGKVAFDLARKKRALVTSIDKANVLESSRLWRKVMEELATGYPDVTLNHMYVDNAAMQLIRDPAQFDVIVTSNLFGDILSDQGGALTGSLGMLPSASMGLNRRGMFEPVHGSAPDIAGKEIANPLGTILSAAMMLRLSLELEHEAQNIEHAVQRALKNGYRTADIMNDGMQLVGTKAMSEAVIRELN